MLHRSIGYHVDDVVIVVIRLFQSILADRTFRYRNIHTIINSEETLSNNSLQLGLLTTDDHSTRFVLISTDPTRIFLLALVVRMPPRSPHVNPLVPHLLPTRVEEPAPKLHQPSDPRFLGEPSLDHLSALVLCGHTS